jgi:Protein chain release factor A
MWDSIDQLRSEHGELQEKLADPAVHQNPGMARKLNRRYWSSIDRR